MTQEKNQVQSNYSVPIAIIIAGLIIGGALYFGNNRSETEIPNDQNNEIQTTQDTIRPISEDDHIRGNPNAKILFLEYSDTECPYCKRFQTTVQKIMDTYGKDGTVAWVYRHFPLDFHKKSRKEAEATECANELGGNDAFWKMLDTIYTETPANDGLDPAKLPEFAQKIGLNVSAFNSCLSSGKYADKIEADLADGLAANVTGTPHSLLLLREDLTDKKRKEIANYVDTQKIYDSQNNPLIYTSNDKKVVVSGALTEEMIKSIIEIIIK